MLNMRKQLMTRLYHRCDSIKLLSKAPPPQKKKYLVEFGTIDPNVGGVGWSR